MWQSYSSNTLNNKSDNNSAGFAVASLVCGILSLFFGYFMPLIGVISSFITGYLGFKGINSKEKSSAYIGFLLAVISIPISILRWFYYSNQ